MDEYIFDLNREMQIYNENFINSAKNKIHGWCIQFLAFIQKIINRIKIIFFKIKTIIKKKTIDTKMSLVDFKEPSLEIKNKINNKFYNKCCFFSYILINDINDKSTIELINKFIDRLNRLTILNSTIEFDYYDDDDDIYHDQCFYLEYDTTDNVNSIDVLRKSLIRQSKQCIKEFDIFYNRIFSSLDKLTKVVNQLKSKNMNDITYTEIERKSFLFIIECNFSNILKILFKKINNYNQALITHLKKYNELYTKIINYNDDKRINGIEINIDDTEYPFKYDLLIQ